MAKRRRPSKKSRTPLKKPRRRVRPRLWIPPGDVVALAAELIVQGVAIDQVIDAVAEKVNLELAGARADELLNAAMGLIRKRAEHLKRHAGDLEAVRLEHLYRKALTTKDYRAAMSAHRELAALGEASPAVEAEAAPAPPYSFADRYRHNMADERGA